MQFTGYRLEKLEQLNIGQIKISIKFDFYLNIHSRIFWSAPPEVSEYKIEQSCWVSLS